MSGELEQDSWPPEKSGTVTLNSPLDAARSRTRKPIVLGAIGAALVHALVIAVALAQSDNRPEKPKLERPAIEAEIIQEAPKPVPVPVPVPRSALPEPPPAPRAMKKATSLEKAAPVAAQAAKVMTAEPKEVLDFGETFVQGNAASYAGGVTEAGGTSKKAVRDANARAFGVEGGKGTGAADLSREPSLADGVKWDCPFPKEADDDGLDTGVVTLKVTISANGTVDDIAVKTDPGHGFGREARRCALRKRWQTGLDRAGKAVTATKLLNVRFTRP